MENKFNKFGVIQYPSMVLEASNGERFTITSSLHDGTVTVASADTPHIPYDGMVAMGIGDSGIEFVSVCKELFEVLKPHLVELYYFRKFNPPYRVKLSHGYDGFKIEEVG